MTQSINRSGEKRETEFVLNLRAGLLVLVEPSGVPLRNKIARAISKSDERETRHRFEITSSFKFASHEEL